MPASRSRTERWRDSLQQIQDRNGGIEFTIARRASIPRPITATCFSACIVRMDDNELVVEADGDGQRDPPEPRHRDRRRDRGGSEPVDVPLDNAGNDGDSGPARLDDARGEAACPRMLNAAAPPSASASFRPRKLACPEVECYPLLDPAVGRSCRSRLPRRDPRGIPQGSRDAEVGPMFKAEARQHRRRRCRGCWSRVIPASVWSLRAGSDVALTFAPKSRAPLEYHGPRRTHALTHEPGKSRSNCLPRRLLAPLSPIFIPLPGVLQERRCPSKAA